MSDKKPTLSSSSNNDPNDPNQEPEYTGNALKFALLWFGLPFLLVVLIAALKVA